MSAYSWIYIVALVLCQQWECRSQNNSNTYYVSLNQAIQTNDYYDVTKINATYLQQKLNKSAEYKELMEDGVLAKYAKHLEYSSIIFGLALVANESNVNNQCHQQLKIIQHAILRKEPWAMKVLDASGSKPSGFMFGQNFWLGSREACGAVQQPVGITLSKDFERVMYDGIITQMAPFDMNYRVIYLRHNSPWQVEIKLMSEQIIHIGLCLPKQCDSDEVQKLTAEYMNSGSFIENNIYDIQPEVIYMKDLQLPKSFYEKKSFKMIGAFTLFTMLIMLLAGLLRIQPITERKQNQIAEQAKNSQDHSTLNSGNFITNFKNIAKCFDVSANCEKMFRHTNNSASEIPVINGLRSICAIWILIFHVVWFMYFTVNNKTFLISYAERVFFQYVSSAPLLVDVFFTISGFLQIYNFLRKTKQMELIRENGVKENCRLFIQMLFHRYLRLAPLYIVVMGVVDIFYAYMASVSVYHINERFDEICSNHWWRNLLFIQNFFDHQDMCLNWTWSLACEMQFFILSSILLFIYAKHPRIVKVIVSAALMCTVLWTYSIGLSSKFLLSFDSAFATGTEIYINPFVRVMPYIFGAVTAWYFVVQQQGQLDISETKERCLWNLAILLFFSCIYSTIKRDMTYMQSISLFVIGRTLFSLSICWMIVGSATGRGSWWSRLLELKIFQHLNRLSYAIYLLNPFVIAVFFSLTSVSTHADPFMLCVLTSGFVMIVYVAAIVFSLAFEMPYCNLSSLLLRQVKKKIN